MKARGCCAGVTSEAAGQPRLGVLKMIGANMEWTRMMQLPDFKLRVAAVKSGMPMEAFNAPADFIVAWLAANKA
jgi:hypothetical protein